jgi:Raf kinase inhibitor-like YbhB/YbcL family protein
MKIFIEVIIIATLMVGFVAAGAPVSSKNLTVNLGFNKFPKEYTCDGMNVSPRIDISSLNATPGVKSAAMIMEDPDAPRGTFIHWMIWNMTPEDVIPGNIPKVENVTAPIVATQGANGAGNIGYIGPCPPKGAPHRYFLRVYGLDEMLNLKPGSNRSELEKAMNGHIVIQGETMATYGM